MTLPPDLRALIVDVLADAIAEAHRRVQPTAPADRQEPAELLDVKKATAYSGLTPWTIRTLIWNGTLSTVDLGMRRIWIRRIDLDAVLARRQQTEPAPPPAPRRSRRPRTRT